MRERGVSDRGKREGGKREGWGRVGSDVYDTVHHVNTLSLRKFDTSSLVRKPKVAPLHGSIICGKIWLQYAFLYTKLEVLVVSI